VDKFRDVREGVLRDLGNRYDMVAIIEIQVIVGE
jgi:hypothetical protein